MNSSDYKFYPARSNILLLLVICLFCFDGCSRERKITESEVLELMNKVEAAAKIHDPVAITDNMSEKVEIKVTNSAPGNTQTSRFNRDQYRNVLLQTYAGGSNYTYSRQRTLVEISPDGKTAIVMAEVLESIMVNGRLIRSISAEVSTLGRENGKLVIQYVESNGMQN